MYIVTKSGHRLPVDDSAIGENVYTPLCQTVGLYTENAELAEVWVVELNKSGYHASQEQFDLQIVKELKYYHEPTKDEILWAMSAYGCSRWDIVFIRKGYELDFAEDEEE